MRLRSLLLLAPFVCVASVAQAEGGSLPQLDAAWFPNQLFWLAVSFAVLFTVVSRFIAPTIGNILATREQAITNAIAEAERAKQEAETTRGDFESTGNSARAKAAEIMATAQAKSSAAATEALARMDHDVARKIDQANARLAEAVAKAQSGLEAATVSLAAAMVEKLLGHAVTDASVSEAVKPMAKAS